MDFPESPFFIPLYHLLMLAVVVVDVVLPIVPSELMVIASGTMASHGRILFIFSLLAAALGSWLGDVLLFVLFRNRLTHWLDRFRWGRAVHKGIRNTLDSVGKSPTYAGLVALRFIPGGRTASVAAAGIADIPLRPFLGLTAVGSLLWGGWLTGLGFVTGATTGLPLWVSVLLGTAVGTLVGLIIAAFIALKNRRKGKNPHEHADPAQAAEESN